MGYNSQFLSGVALSASFNSGPQQIIDAKLYSIQLKFTGSTCEFSTKIQVSSDPYGTVPTNWDDLADSTEAFTEAGTFTYDVTDAGYVYVRLVVTDSSSGMNTGELSARINVKGPGI